MRASRIVFMLIFAIVWMLLPASEAVSAEYRRQTIVNGSNKTANDLHIAFNNRVDETKLRPKAQPPGKDADGSIPAYPNNKHSDWAPPDTFGTIGPGGTAYVDYGYSGYKPMVDSENSYFTDDGVPLPNFKKKGMSFGINVDQFDKRSAYISNDETTPQEYSNVELWKDNSPGNLDIDHYFIPTGVQVLGVPATFVLLPGEVAEFDFGDLALDTYVLLKFEGMPVGGIPEEAYMGYETSFVPEPITLSLLALGGLSLIRRRRFDATHRRRN